MKKTLIAGLATIVIASTAFLATGMYAATTNSSGTLTTYGMSAWHMKKGNPEDLVTTLSGKVSAEALTALQTLMAKNKTEMDTLRSSGTTINKTTMDAQHAAFKTEMDALMVKYPELKTAMPEMRKGEKMGRGNGEIEDIMATLPTTVQTEINTIRESYQTKQEALRTEEKTQIDTVLSAYPDIKAKIDTAEAKRPEGKWMRSSHEGDKNQEAITNTSK